MEFYIALNQPERKKKECRSKLSSIARIKRVFVPPKHNIFVFIEKFTFYPSTLHTLVSLRITHSHTWICVSDTQQEDTAAHLHEAWHRWPGKKCGQEDHNRRRQANRRRVPSAPGGSTPRRHLLSVAKFVVLSRHARAPGTPGTAKGEEKSRKHLSSRHWRRRRERRRETKTRRKEWRPAIAPRRPPQYWDQLDPPSLSSAEEAVS